MWGLWFEIKAPFGHFRNPYTTSLKQSYPFPPKPTIIGMVGAMLGWDEKIVVDETDNFKIAISEWEYLKKIIEFTFIFSAGKVKGKSRAQEEFRPERFELLLYPSYQIIIMHDTKKLIEEIERRINTKEFEFPLYMGKNEFLISEIKVLKPSFSINVCKVNTVTGVVFKDGNLIPEFTVNSSKPHSAEVFIGVPKSLEIFQGKRIQKEVCIALTTKTPIKLKEPLIGIKIDESEFTII